MNGLFIYFIMFGDSGFFVRWTDDHEEEFESFIPFEAIQKFWQRRNFPDNWKQEITYNEMINTPTLLVEFFYHYFINRNQHNGRHYNSKSKESLRVQN